MTYMHLFIVAKLMELNAKNTHKLPKASNTDQMCPFVDSPGVKTEPKGLLLALISF